MAVPVALRILEVSEGEFVVQFESGFMGWTTFSDTFDNEADAQAFLQEQLDSADYDAE